MPKLKVLFLPDPELVTVGNLKQPEEPEPGKFAMIPGKETVMRVPEVPRSDSNLSSSKRIRSCMCHYDSADSPEVSKTKQERPAKDTMSTEEVKQNLAPILIDMPLFDHQQSQKTLARDK